MEKYVCLSGPMQFKSVLFSYTITWNKEQGKGKSYSSRVMNTDLMRLQVGRTDEVFCCQRQILSLLLFSPETSCKRAAPTFSLFPSDPKCALLYFGHLVDVLKSENPTVVLLFCWAG